MPVAKQALPASLIQKPMTSSPTHADGYCQSPGDDLGLATTYERAYVYE